MKFSACFALLGLAAISSGSPSPGANDWTTAKSFAKPDSYGPFKWPIVPSLPPNLLPKPPVSADGNSTCNDANSNPLLPNSPNHRGNWAPGFNINTNSDSRWPFTGKTVYYTLTITNQTLSPDGVPKQMLVVNGQYPGPTITANWGDYLEITVVNKMKYNGTSMHWHGLRQLGTNLADGAGGVTECPIAPGDSRVYRFQATQYGPSWYHSHFSVQYGDGVLGPILINGPTSANYDIDLGTVLITDYYSRTAPQEDWFAHRQGPPKAKNFLINGQNVAVDGSTGKRAQFQFTPGKRHLLRLINTSLDALFKMSIDGHKLKVVGVDFVPIVPYWTNEVAINLGQRYMVIVEADQKPGNYYFRAMAALDCTNIANDGTGTANAIVSYTNSPNPAILPTSTATNHTNTCVDEPIGSLVPVIAQSVDSTNFQTTVVKEEVDIQVILNPEFVFQWTLGGISQLLDWSKPVIEQAVGTNTTYEPLRNVVKLNQADVWTFWIIQNKFFVPHPMHLHGHDFNLLGQGNGIFNPSTDMSKLNFKNPPRRDVATLVASGWSVISFKTDNPGAWLMHCHIAWHAGEGLSLNFLERPNDIPRKYRSDVQGSDFQQRCKNWKTYDKTSVWPQYDSGLKKRDANGNEVVDWSGSRFLKIKERMASRRRSQALHKGI